MGGVHYSEEEQVIGTWIDGKPLYQKTIEVTVPKDTNSIPITLDSDIDIIIDVSGCLKSPDTSGSVDDYTLFLNHSEASANYLSAIFRSGPHQLFIMRNLNWSGTAFITVRYTKTTD